MYVDSRTRRGPPKGPQGPRPGNGGGSGGGGSGGGGGGPGSTGGGGAVFETINDDARFRSAPAGVPLHWASPPRPTAPPPTPMATAQPPGRILTPIQEPLQSSPPPIPVTRPSSAAVGWPPPGSIPIPQDGAPPYRSHPGTFDMPNPPMYAGSIDGGLPSARLVPGRRVSFRPEGATSFRPEGAMARPRQDEENRGEPEAAGPAGRHDITPPGPL